MKILFLLGSANLSGGTYVILQHAQHLQKMGHEVVIALVFMKLDEFHNLKNSDKCWHPAIKELNFIHIDEIKNNFDIAIFTWWATLFYFEKIHAKKYIYFVQSIESRFYPSEETFMQDLVNRTYQLGLPVITEAVWIKEYLETNYHSQCELVRNGILKSVYTKDGETYAGKADNQLRILVEGPLNVAFKNVERTIQLCKEANVGEVWLLTSSAVKDYPGITKIFSQIPISEVPAIYRSCDVIVKLSYVEGMFGPPLEMFHCGGTAIVYDVTGFDEYIVHEKNALVVKRDAEQTVVKYLQLLNQDRNLLERLIVGAQQTAQNWIDWEMSSNQFAQSIENVVSPSYNEIQNHLRKFLRERIEVITVKDNLYELKKIETLPLYDSGYYALTIPITRGNTQIGIQFGKHYQSLLISNINFIGTDDPQLTMNVNLHLNEMSQKAEQIYNCTASGAMIFKVDANYPIDFLCHLRIEFKPIALVF